MSGINWVEERVWRGNEWVSGGEEVVGCDGGVVRARPNFQLQDQITTPSMSSHSYTYTHKSQ